MKKDLSCDVTTENKKSDCDVTRGRKMCWFSYVIPLFINLKSVCVGVCLFIIMHASANVHPTAIFEPFCMLSVAQPS